MDELNIKLHLALTGKKVDLCPDYLLDYMNSYKILQAIYKDLNVHAVILGYELEPDTGEIGQWYCEAHFQIDETEGMLKKYHKTMNGALALILLQLRGVD